MACVCSHDGICAVGPGGLDLGLGEETWETCFFQVPANFPRDLRHLDNTGSREVHKIAVIYVPDGPMVFCSLIDWICNVDFQEKHAILSSNSSSEVFSKFVNEMGWEIRVGRRHEGYSGGLPADSIANYYATPDSEVRGCIL